MWRDSRTGSLNRKMAGFDAKVGDIALSYNGRYLSASDYAGYLRIWDLTSGDEVVLMRLDSQAASIVFPANQTSLMVGTVRSVTEYDLAGLLPAGR